MLPRKIFLQIAKKCDNPYFKKNTTVLITNKIKKTIIIISLLDNLIKGAAGQAIQNMNLSCIYLKMRIL